MGNKETLVVYSRWVFVLLVLSLIGHSLNTEVSQTEKQLRAITAGYKYWDYLPHSLSLSLLAVSVRQPVATHPCPSESVFIFNPHLLPVYWLTGQKT